MVHQMHEKVECSIAPFGPRQMGVGIRRRSATRGVDSTSAEPDKSNPVSTPGQDPKNEKEEEESALLDNDKVSGYRQFAGKS